MQSLQDLHLFDDDQNFQKQKEETIQEQRGVA
jgi:primosomal protein DnaI